MGASCGCCPPHPPRRRKAEKLRTLKEKDGKKGSINAIDACAKTNQPLKPFNVFFFSWMSGCRRSSLRS
jgi:hypothetical protein